MTGVAIGLFVVLVVRELHWHRFSKNVERTAGEMKEILDRD